MTVQTTYRDMDRSEALDRLVDVEAAKLQRFFPRIVRCRVLIEKPHNRKGAPFHVRIELGVPGDELVVSHVPSISKAWDDETERPEDASKLDAPYKNAQRAIRDAFLKVERRLGDYASRKMGK